MTSIQCSVQLQVSEEPRLGLTKTVPLQITEARDVQGNSLLGAGQGASVLTRNAGYLGMTCSSAVHVRAPLNRPENPGRTIKILRGVIPLQITARQTDPLVIPLASATGKSFDKGDLHVVVHEVHSDPNNRQRQIELTVRESRAEALPAGDEAFAPNFGTRLDPYQQNLGVVDARGQAFPWFQTSVDMGQKKCQEPLCCFLGRPWGRSVISRRVKKRFLTLCTAHPCTACKLAIRDHQILARRVFRRDL